MKKLISELARLVGGLLRVRPEERANFEIYYFNNGFYGGFYMGFLVAVIYALDGKFLLALIAGSLLWLFFICLFLFVIYPVQEIYKPNRLKRRMKSSRYQFLHSSRFEVIDNAFFRGVYNSFLFEVYPYEKKERKKKNIKYDVISCAYVFENSREADCTATENIMSGSYYFGELYFRDNSVSFIPFDWKETDFQGNFDRLILVLQREKLFPVGFEELCRLRNERNLRRAEVKADLAESVQQSAR